MPQPLPQREPKTPPPPDAEVQHLRDRLAAAERRADKLAHANAALRKTLEPLERANYLEALLGHTLKSIADQIGVAAASAWVFDADLVAHLVWTLVDGQTVRGPQSTHVNAGKASKPTAWHREWLRGMEVPMPKLVPVAEHSGLHEDQRAYLLGRGVQALLSVPMVLDKQLVGSFTVHLTAQDDPLADDLELIQALANQATLVFRLTRLAEDAREAAVARERQRAAEQRAAKFAQVNAALRTTVESLGSVHDSKAFLGRVLELMADLVGAPSGGLFLVEDDHLHLMWLREGSKLVDGPVSSHPNANCPVPLTDYASQWRDAGFGDTVPRVWICPGHKEEQRARMRAIGAKAMVDVPMVFDEGIVGVFTLGAPDGSLPAEDLELIQTLANQATLALRLTRLSEAARAAAVSDERNRLARDIHDTLAQGLAAIVRQLESAAAGRGSSAAALRHMSVATEIARDSLVEARRSIRALRPPSLEGRTLDGAIQDLVQRSARLSSAALTFHGSGDCTGIPSDVEEELLRIVNEALSNAIKHGTARTIDVELSSEKGGVRVVVRDDGTGFDQKRVRRDGVGLSSMRERAHRAGAILTVASEPGHGTEVLVYWTPVAQKDEVT